MSKNKQMLSETIMTVGPFTPTTGPASLVQGVYGARGNLELVACDDTDGLWVFWFNSDLPDDPGEAPDVQTGSWSSGLAFAQGARYRQAQILQSTVGPDHLEVLALRDDGVLESWYWSPGLGFQRRPNAVADGVGRFTARHHDGRITVTMTDGGTERALTSGTQGYPERAWAVAQTGPVIDDGSEAAAVLRAAGIAPADVAEGSARAARSDRDGGRIELTWRDSDDRLRHLAIRG